MSRQIVIGDIHGCIRSFRKLLEDRISLRQGDELILVGDLIDRGPDPKGVIDHIFRLIEAGFRIRTVRGNHEQMLLDAIDDPGRFPIWMYNGADATLRSFGKEDEDFKSSDPGDLIPEHYREFFRNMDYYIELQEYFIVHAGFNFRKNDPFSDTYAMVWSRSEMYDREKAGGKKIIHGHTPVALDEIRVSLLNDDAPLINIDAGCVYPRHPGLGHLAAIETGSMELYVQENCDEIN